MRKKRILTFCSGSENILQQKFLDFCFAGIITLADDELVR